MITENQIVDTETMEIRDKTPEEMGHKPEESKSETKTNDTSDDDNQEDPKAKKTEEPKKEETSEEESEEEEVENKEEEEEEGEEEEDSKREEPAKSEDDEVTVDDFLSEKYADKYDIHSEKDLDDVLTVSAELEKENDELKAKLNELEKNPSKLKFESEQEEKAFNFIKNYPMDRMGEGMQTFGKIITMDLKTADPKIILEEKFILENPELTRDEALKKFNRDYGRKYVVKAEEFDGDEAGFKEEQEMRAIDLKADVARARDFLSKKQTELKSKPKEAENKEQEKENESVISSIKTNTMEIDEYMKDFESLIFTPDGDTEEFVYKLSKDQKKQVQEALKGWVGNRNSYDAKGKLLGSKGLDEDTQNISYHLFGPDMIEKAYKHGLKKGEIKRADQIGKEKPVRTSKGSSGEMKNLTEVDQWQAVANESKKGRRQLS